VAVKTDRADKDAVVRVDSSRCKLCGLCVKICKGGPLYIEGNKVLVDYSLGLGCMACGHCAAVCPQGCITVEGRDLAPEDLEPLPPQESRATYDELKSLLLSRRSVREFQNRDVAEEDVDKIIFAATTAPMGIPPSDVKVLVFSGRAKVREFKNDMLAALKPMIRIFSGPMLFLMRPFLGKQAVDMFRTFLVPLARDYIEKDKQGIDLFAYDAPLAMLFYSEPGADAADPLIAATYAMIAAESLGVGTCMLGFPAPLLKRDKKLLAKYAIPPKSAIGIMVIFGYPAVKFQRSIRRRFADIRYW
jgi:nitroreductase/NAD-dependent dihydropyrimidine dehydrogenase PreA subunit